jgi:type I restriction enzyme R subunit
MNQNPKQLARDIIDADLIRCGWVIQPKTKINLNAALMVADRENQK